MKGNSNITDTRIAEIEDGLVYEDITSQIVFGTNCSLYGGVVFRQGKRIILSLQVRHTGPVANDDLLITIPDATPNIGTQNIMAYSMTGAYAGYLGLYIAKAGTKLRINTRTTMPTIPSGTIVDFLISGEVLIA